MRDSFVLVVMGVCGCGKTTIGMELASVLEVSFFDADDFHAEANKKKMGEGIPLTDEDRAPWLARLSALCGEHLDKGRSLVLACSALKQSYRDVISSGDCRVRFIYLRGSMDLFRARMAPRKNHYMKEGMLESQFAALEEPKDAIVVDAGLPPAEAVAAIIAGLEV